MKINRSKSRMAAVFSVAVLLSGQAFCLSAQGQSIDPITGLPRGTGPSGGGLDPATGMPRGVHMNTSRWLPPELGQQTPTTVIEVASRTQGDVHGMIFNGQYEEALKELLSYHDQFKTSGPLAQLLPDWIELGRRFPDARAALIKIRDHDVKEFAEGRGFCDLFLEVEGIDNALHQDEVTYELFKTFRDKDADLAQQCYTSVETILMSKGDYQWCYDHMGDPEARFTFACESFGRERTSQMKIEQLQQQNEERIAKWHQQQGLTNGPFFSRPNVPGILRKYSTDRFIGQTRQIIEILVATGHKEEAAKMRDQAVATLDDPRLESAVSDAIEKVHNQSELKPVSE